MTLILGGITKESAFLASDRRISLNGQLVDDEITKCFFITTPDSRGVFAFTGLAYCNDFKTENLICDTLDQLAKTLTNIEPILRELRNELNATFNSEKITCTNRYLTLLYIGYLYTQESCEPRIFRISNFELGGAPGNFIFTEHDTGQIQVAGQRNSVDNAQLEKLNKLLGENKMEAVNIVSYMTIAKASSNPLSNNSVGQKANVCTFTSEVNTPMTSTYYSEVLTRKCFGANSLILQPGGCSTFLSSEMTVPNDYPSTVIPKMGNNILCSCGSGIKYKFCHKKIEYPYQPMFNRIMLTDGTSYDSGSSFIVLSVGAY